jgi:hypothetical protein
MAGSAAKDVPVAKNCTPNVNSRLADLVKDGTRHDVDNVMVCGVTTRPSQPQRPGRNGGHRILSLRVELPGIGTCLVQVAINDALDGIITAPAHAIVFAYGQAYLKAEGSSWGQS